MSSKMRVRFSRQNAQVLRDNKVKVMEKNLSDWFDDMQRSPAAAGHRCPTAAHFQSFKEKLILALICWASC